MTDEVKKVNEITATKKIGDVEKTSTIQCDFGGSLKTAVEKFGEEVVYSNFVRSAVITAQAAMRRFLEDGKAQEEILAKMAGWRPGVPLERVVDPVASFMARFTAASPEEQEKLLADLRAKQKPA
jgi:hypothetical protein